MGTTNLFHDVCARMRLEEHLSDAVAEGQGDGILATIAKASNVQWDASILALRVRVKPKPEALAHTSCRRLALDRVVSHNVKEAATVPAVSPLLHITERVLLYGRGHILLCHAP